MLERCRTIVFLVLATLLVAGCDESASKAPARDKTPPNQVESPPGEAAPDQTTTNIKPFSTGSKADNSALEANAMALGIDRAAWSGEAIPEGNFATIRVPGEAGMQEPLSIESLSVSVTIEGRMARTEVTQIFRNHLSRQTEGTYEFVLPSGAAISRLAMDVEGKMMEGELVERERARLIYEGIVRQQKDPALLEWQGGERFKTQIFPIPASGTKTVKLTYEEMMPEDRAGLAYRYNLPNLEGQKGSEIGAFEFVLDSLSTRPLEVRGYQAKVTKNPQSQHVSIPRKNFSPTGAIEVAFGEDVGGAKEEVIRVGARMIESEEQHFFMIDHTPTLPQATAKGAKHYVFAIDTSAGLGDAVVDQSKLTTLMLIDALEDDAKFNIVHGDLRAHTCGEAPLGKADREAAVACLKGLDAGGATDLGALLSQATVAAAELEGETAVVLFSDGVASIGELDGELIHAQTVEALTSRQITLHAVAVGHSPAESELQELARSTRGHSVRMNPTSPPHHIARHLHDRLHEPLLTNVAVVVADGSVEYLTPSSAEHLARGEALTILGRITSPSATIKVTGNYAGQAIEETFTVETASAGDEPSMLSNFWARAAIPAMESAGRHRKEVSAHSLKYGVMSRYTSFLVLENDEAYKRFNVERKKEATRELENSPKKTAQNLKKGDEDLQNMLAARPLDPGVLGVEANTEGALGGLKGFTGSEASQEYALRMSGSGVGGGGLGGGQGVGGSTSGRGSGDGGYGADAGGGIKERAQMTPRLKPGRFQSTGNFDKKIIKRVVSRNKRKITNCYERELRKDPGLRGRVTIKWRISGTGHVDLVTVESNEMGSSAVSDCLVDTIKTWRFPAPTGGTAVEVKYPFNFDAGRGGRYVPPSIEDRISDLESRRDSLSGSEVDQLALLYLEGKRTADAERLIDDAIKRFSKGERSEAQIFSCFRSPNVQIAFPERFNAATVALFEALIAADPQAPIPSGISEALYKGMKDGEEATYFARGAHDDLFIQRALVSLVNEKKEAQARALFNAIEPNLDDARIVVVLNRSELHAHFGEKVYQSSSRVIKQRPEDMAAFLRHLVLGAKTGHEDEALGLLKMHCTESAMVFVTCHTLLAEFDPARADRVRAEIIAARMKNMARIRSRDIGNPALIMDFVAMLHSQAKHDEADRLMSEIVEFSPHQFTTREQYGHELKKLERPIEACQAYATAVQIDPAKRDTFRTMMSLRREFLDAGKGLRDCIVQGVSNLPVKRDVSLVMTWEDPSADVDLHIDEATGESVNYTHQESAQGGLLYYDITDGFGPEIYVLGGGEEGTYGLSVVYYSGSAMDIKGTLTILRNAGAPNETREDIEFTLPTANSSKKIPLGEFKL